MVFEGDRIVFVGHGFSGEVEEQRDYGMALIAPGFIDLDALADLDTTILGFDNQPAWRKGRVWPRSYIERGPYEMYSPEELAFQKRYAFAQLLRNGITTALPIASLFYRAWGETTAEFSAAADAAARSGTAGLSRPGLSHRQPGRRGTTDAIVPDFDEARGLARARGGHRASASAMRARRTAWSARCWRPIASRPARRNCCGAPPPPARELDVPVRLHCCQSRLESTWCWTARHEPAGMAG